MMYGGDKGLSESEIYKEQRTKANGKKALKIHCLGAIKAMSTV